MTTNRQYWEDLRDGTVWLVEVCGGQVRAALGPLAGPRQPLNDPDVATILAAPPAATLGTAINARAHEFGVYRP